VRAKLKKASKVSQLLFSAAYNYKLFLLKSGVPFGWVPGWGMDQGGAHG
jgi:hypothetical protein